MKKLLFLVALLLMLPACDDAGSVLIPSSEQLGNPGAPIDCEEDHSDKQHN